MMKNLSDRFRSIVRITRICGDICGCDVLNHNYRINIRTVLVLAVIQLSFIFLSYTMYDGFMIKGDWKVILQVLSIGGGTLIQGFCKLVNAIREQKNFRFLADELNSIYDEYEVKNSEYRRYLNKGINLLTYIMKLSAFIIILMVLGMTVVALVLALVFGERELILQCIIPGLDPTTEKGFILTNAVLIGFVAVGGFGFYAGDMAFFTPISQIVTFSGILRCKFCDLNEALEQEPENKQKSMEILQDIIIFHQRYMRFLSVTQDTYFWVILVQISTYSMGIVCTLFCILLGAWPGGYVYMTYCFVMMYVYCGIETLVEITNDGVIESCYNDVRWYDLSISEKKMLRIMLTMSQSTSGLTIGSVLPLSMNTGLQVTKTIYSIAMMLINFAK